MKLSNLESFVIIEKPFTAEHAKYYAKDAELYLNLNYSASSILNLRELSV
jgi:hypothetical protein